MREIDNFAIEYIFNVNVEYGLLGLLGFEWYVNPNHLNAWYVDSTNPKNRIPKEYFKVHKRLEKYADHYGVDWEINKTHEGVKGINKLYKQNMAYVAFCKNGDDNYGLRFDNYHPYNAVMKMLIAMLLEHKKFLNTI